MERRPVEPPGVGTSGVAPGVPPRCAPPVWDPGAASVSGSLPALRPIPEHARLRAPQTGGVGLQALMSSGCALGAHPPLLCGKPVQCADVSLG